jgi:hypothetical protein
MQGARGRARQDQGGAQPILPQPLADAARIALAAPGERAGAVGQGLRRRDGLRMP